jgi:hypothetical protein
MDWQNSTNRPGTFNVTELDEKGTYLIRDVTKTLNPKAKKPELIEIIVRLKWRGGNVQLTSRRHLP